MSKDRDVHSRDFVQKVQFYDSQIKLLENDSLSKNDHVKLLKLKTERQQLVSSETQQAMDTKDEWLTNPKLIAAKKKSEAKATNFDKDKFLPSNEEEMEH